MQATRRPTGGDGDTAPDWEDVSVVRVVNILLRRRRQIGLVILALAALGAAGTLVLGDRYTAMSSFKPQVRQQNLNQFAGVAAQFGLDIGAAAMGGESVSFYAQLLQSREIMEGTVLHSYRFPTETGGADTLEGNLVELYDAEGDDPVERLLEAVERLRESVRVDAALDAGVIALETSAPWPGLAEQINRRLLNLMHRFDLEKRQSQAGAEREFVQERMQQAREDLLAAEAELQRFLENNRGYENSPPLNFEATRLRNEVDLQRQIYTTLAQAYEQARIEEVRNTPVITVIDNPEGSARDDGPSVVLNTLLGLVGGLFVGIGLALTMEYIERQRRERPGEYAEFDTLRAETLAALTPRRVWARVREARSSPRRPAPYDGSGGPGHET